MRNTTLSRTVSTLALLIAALPTLPASPATGSDHPAPSPKTDVTPSPTNATVIVVVGAAGEEIFGRRFADWATLWREHAAAAAAQHIEIGLTPESDTSDLDQLKTTLAGQPRSAPEPLWIILLGHGTYDGKTARFNLRGPDLAAEALAEQLSDFDRPLVIANCASASAPFIKPLSATGRVILSATRSGFEQNFAYFGQYLAVAVGDPGSDLDQDGQTSALEAFLGASRQLELFYQAEGRLATEHALVDDNGDGMGTPADWFRGTRVVKKAAEGALPDGLFAHQMHLLRSEEEKAWPPDLRAQRNALERDLARLRERKPSLAEDDYYHQLEILLLELARLYEQVNRTPSPAPEAHQNLPGLHEDTEENPNQDQGDHDEPNAPEPGRSTGA